MQSRTASRIKLGVVLILVVLIAVLGLTGSLRIGKYRFYPFADFLAARGWIWAAACPATYAADGSAGGQATPQLLASTESVLRARLDALELDEATRGPSMATACAWRRPPRRTRKATSPPSARRANCRCLDSSGQRRPRRAATLTSPAVSTVYDADGNPYPAVDFRPSEEAVQALAVAERRARRCRSTSTASSSPRSPRSQLSEQRRGLHPADQLRHRRRGRAGGAAAGGHPRLGRNAAGSGKHAPGDDLPAAGRERRNAGVRRRAGGAGAGASSALIARYRLPGAAAALGVAIWALLTVIFLCELSFATHVALRRGRRADGPVA